MKHAKEYLSVLEQLGVKPTGDGCSRYIRTKRVRLRAWAVIAGAIVLTSVVWTVRYDGSTKALISAERTEVHNDYTLNQRRYLATVVFLAGTGGVDTWQVPEKWNNADNYIEALGPGGNGGSASGSVGGGSAGGGAYAKTNNVQLVPRGTASYRVGLGGTHNSTWLSNTGVAPTTTAQGVLAECGYNASSTSGNIGGRVAQSIGDTLFRGGNGKNGGTTFSGLFTFPSYAGAGGAAGPGGRGGDGLAGQNGAIFWGGGAGAGNSGAGADSASSTGAAGSDGGGDGGTNGPGGAGTNWDASHGSGGGGASNGGGGLYGGGGGGNGGPGAQGLLVITYTPAVTQDDMMHWCPQPVNLKLHARAPRKRWLMQIPYRMLKWRHLHFYNIVVTEPYEVTGPGQEDIRKAEPALSRIRTATLMRLRVINPSLEE